MGKLGICFTTSEQTSCMKAPPDETKERPRKMAQLLSGLQLNSGSQAFVPAPTATTTGREYSSPDSIQRAREELLTGSPSNQPGDIYTIEPREKKPSTKPTSTMMAATKNCQVATFESGQRVFHYNFHGVQNVTLNYH